MGIKEYMNVPWMPLADVEATEPSGNSLDPSADRREQSGRGFTATGARPANRTAAAANSTSARPAPAPEDDQFPYDEVQSDGGNGTGTAAEIREPVLRPKSRFRMYRMPDGGANGGNATASLVADGTEPVAATAERSFIVHLLPQKLMNMIEQAEKYARMAFSPFMWPTKERAQRALKHFPRSVDPSARIS